MFMFEQSGFWVPGFVLVVTGKLRRLTYKDYWFEVYYSVP